MAKNEIVTSENFNLVVLSGDMAEAVKEEMDGLGSLPFDRVKIPSGGNTVFELPGEDEDDTEVTTTLTGVILYHYPVNAYWKEAYSGASEKPCCSSLNGKQGLNTETGEIIDCDRCPYNQFGSSGNGKACKNTHRCYILREGNPIPLLLTLPPTSLKYLRDYIGKKVVLKGLRCYEVITAITLKKEKSNDGIQYSRAAFKFVGTIDNEKINEVKTMANTVKNMVQPDVASDDYIVPQDNEDMEFVNGDSRLADEIMDKLANEDLPPEFEEVKE